MRLGILFCACMLLPGWGWAQSLEEWGTRVREAQGRVERFQQIQNMEMVFIAEMQTRASSMDGEVRLAQAELDPLPIFNREYRKWKSLYESTPLASTLKDIAHGKRALTLDELAALKQLRKRAHYVRQMFYLFDPAHHAPKEFEKFVSTFGKLNDALAAHESEAMVEVAGKMRTLMKENDLLELSKRFHVTATADFQAHLTSIFDEMIELSAKDEMTIDEFHTIRKKLKEAKFVYSSLFDVSEEGTYRTMALMIDDEISAMGELNDVYAELKMRGKIDIREYQSRVLPEMRTKIRALVAASQQHFCTVRILSITP